MKRQIFSVALSNDFVALLVAAIAVGCALFFADPVDDVRPIAPINSPHIAIVEDGRADESGISAGFFLPTVHNVHRRASMPQLSCAVEAMDVGSITIFRVGDKARIISSMSIDQNVIEHNILGHMFLENVKDFSAMAVPISAVETRLENVETGEIYGCNCHCIGFDGRTILYHRGGNMAFAAPSALTDSVANVAIEVPYGGSSTKFLKVKNLNQEQQMKDETQ